MRKTSYVITFLGSYPVSPACEGYYIDRNHSCRVHSGAGLYL